jgi:hypothetical protein
VRGNRKRPGGDRLGVAGGSGGLGGTALKGGARDWLGVIAQVAAIAVPPSRHRRASARSVRRSLGVKDEKMRVLAPAQVNAASAPVS